MKEGRWRNRGKKESGGQKKSLSETYFYIYPLTAPKLQAALIFFLIVMANVLLLVFMLECSPGSSKTVS